MKIVFTLRYLNVRHNDPKFWQYLELDRNTARLHNTILRILEAIFFLIKKVYHFIFVCFMAFYSISLYRFLNFFTLIKQNHTI